MTYPFMACLLLAGIHVYLGIHVMQRKVIFVDLALAQIAALGSVAGILLGYSYHEYPWQSKIFSLSFAVFGAPIFAITKMRHEKVPQEAIIGITYAVALALTVLASANLPHGADEIRELFSGSILWVKPEVIYVTACLYGLIGSFHYVFRRKFLRLSGFDEYKENADIDLKNPKLWDFLFYLSFAFVVTSSVHIAGVLLVFAYLVIPAAIAMLLSDNLKIRLILGWGIGTFVSVFGVTYSYFQDLPSGPVIVVFSGLLLAFVGLVKLALIRMRQIA